ncbi:MAG: hypothetical protein ABIQ75_04695 [Flavobacteriales bacterium]
MPGPVREDGSLNDAAIVLLHAVTGVDEQLLHAVRIRPSRSNWLHAPWYRYHRGGAITVGRTIWFTRIWFEPRGLGDGSLRSSWKWLVHLSHEVGHLPQAERFGRSFFAKARYVSSFTWQYASRALLFRRDVHDGSRLEREADLGRQVLLQAIGEAAEAHPVALAVYQNDVQAVREWCARQTGLITKATEEYRDRYLA